MGHAQEGVPAPVGPVIVVGPQPGQIICPSCHATVISRVDHKTNTKTHLLALLLCCICLPFMCVPYCVDSCKNADHYCPQCDAYIGTYQG